ncbi:hypothetical protein MMC20_000532 [Loxospora ochrophaea]|nr:hypothetical protein [Loxospora ochrophaea]
MATDDVSELSTLGLTAKSIDLEDGTGVFSYSRELDSIGFHIPILIPGYGLSPPLPQSSSYDKRTVGLIIINALSKILPPSSRKQPVLLLGHDRGARIAHRLAVDEPLFPHSLCLIGTILLDILPTLTQWRLRDSSPTASVSAFHWPFLANASLATNLITTSTGGGAAWCLSRLNAWQGASNSAGIARLESGDAKSVYARYFSNDSVVRASCEDYAAGAGIDIRMQEEDMAAGRKMPVDLLVIYSEAYLGKKGGVDVAGVWREWADGEVSVEAVGGGVGHFLAEEAPEEVVRHLMDWMRDHGLLNALHLASKRDSEIENSVTA